MYWKNDIETIETSLKKNLDHYRKAAEALSAVVIAKKKNGDEFANLTNAIKNARRVNEYGFDRLQVVFESANARYDSVSVNLYGYQDELPKEDPRRAAPVVGCVRQKYELSADEVRAAVKAAAENYSRLAEKTEKELTIARDYITAFRVAVEEAEEKLMQAGDNIRWYATATR